MFIVNILIVEVNKMVERICRITYGYCPCCRKKTIFVATGYWYRDQYLCVRCKSIPRMRALISVLDSMCQNDYNVKIHESSPSKEQINWMKRYKHYSYSYYYEDKELGAAIDDEGIITNQDLCNLKFKDNSLDIFITQDVMEHVDYPNKAFNEIYRVLKPGGIHIFTTPIYAFQKTHSRISFDSLGNRINVDEPIYHGNPIDEGGALVTYDWGNDIAEFIDGQTGFKTKIVEFSNSKENYQKGLEGDYLEVIVSKKPC